jgi:hypothetical protein
VLQLLQLLQLSPQRVGTQSTCFFTGTKVQTLTQLLRSLLQVPQVLKVLQGQERRAKPPPQPARPALDHRSMRLEFLEQHRRRWCFVALLYYQ